MKLFRNIFGIIFLIPSLLLSCAKVSDFSPEGDTVSLSFASPAIVPEVDSKVPVNGGDFPPSQVSYELGLWLMKNDGSKEPQIKGYGNLKAEYLTADGVNSWSFYPFGSDVNSVNRLYVMKNRAINVYAYHPWVASADDLTAIRFASGEVDWMIAEPLILDESDTRNDIVAPLAFKHLMTCIQVDIRCLYKGSIKVTSMTLNDKKGRLIPSGTFDCTKSDPDQALNLGTPSSSIVLRPNRSLNGQSYVSFYIMMPPVSGLDLADKEMTLSFEFNGIDAETDFVIPATMSGSSQEIEEFKRGYKYIYQLTLDNTIDFIPKGIEPLWTEKEILLPV
jgi:hypothetical protein